MTESPFVPQESVVAGKLQDGFFSSPNEFRLDASDDAIMLELRETLRRHRSGGVDRPVLLPFRSPSVRGTVWYACVPTEAMSRAFESELNAFLGPSYIQLAPADRHPDVADKHAMPLIRTAGWRAIRFEATDVKFEQKVLQQWGAYSQLLNRRPKAASYMPETFGQVRAAFDRALLARNERGALAALSALRERHGLSTENRLFLEIRLAAAFERWEQITEHRLLPTVVNLNLPPETYGDVMEALYWSHVRPFERAPRLQDLVVQFRETVAEIARPLFRTRRTSRRPTVLKAFVLHELAQDEPRAEACVGLLAHLAGGAFGELDAAIRARISSLATTNDFLPAQQALEQEQFDRAYDLLWSFPDDVEVLRGLVVCAREAEDSAKAQAVLARLAAAAPAIREVVEASSPTRLQRLRSIAVVPLKAAADWIEHLARGDGESLDDYVERWREVARSIPSSTILDTPQIGTRAADSLMHQALEQGETFERVYPLWHELFVERVAPDHRLLPVYLALLETIRARNIFTETELTLLRQTLTAAIYAGVDAIQYCKAVDEVHAVFMQIRSPHVLTWALDVCDALAIAPSRDPDARLRLLSAVVQACREFRARLTPVQRGILKMLAAEATLDVVDFEDEIGTPTVGEIDRLRGRLIAFYSLDEAAMRRAIEVLKDIHPELKVESNADLVCTPRLKMLAQRADIFVFAWKSSKHAAYDCVKAFIKSKECLLMSTGGGTASLVATSLQRVAQIV